MIFIPRIIMAKEKYNSTYEGLRAKGYKPQKEYRLDKIYVAKEGRAEYRLEDIICPSVAYDIDGYLINDNTTNKCDKLLLIRVDDGEENSDEQQWQQYFIELKGKNIKDALRQILSTIGEPIFKHHSNIQRFARVASSGAIPKNNSDKTVETLKRELMKKYTCDVLIRSSLSEKFKRSS